MATVVSAQTGAWNVAGTWVGGVPDLSVDDVQIVGTHVVTMGVAPALTLAVGREIEVQSNATLEIQQNQMDIHGFLVVRGHLMTDGGILLLSSVATIDIVSGASFSITGALDMQLEGTIEIESGGLLEIDAAGHLSALTGENINIRAGATLSVFNQGILHVDGGHLHLDAGASASVTDNSDVWVESGVAFIHSDLAISANSRFTVWGDAVVDFDRRDIGIISDDDGHTIIDYSHAHGLRLGVMRIG